MKTPEFPKVIKRGSVSVTIYETPSKGYHSYTIVYYQKGQRKRETNADYTAILNRAREILGDLETGREISDSLSGAERETYSRALKTLAATGKPMDVAVSHYAQAVKILGGDLVIEAAREYANRHGKAANGTGWNVYITNFVEYTNTGAILTNIQPIDLSDPTALNSWIPVPGSLVYGVPIIVGAKKGLPNFNEFSMESAFQITRLLQLTRTSTNRNIAPPSTYNINQLFDCSISNVFGVECWNSYFSNYTRPTTIWIADHIQMGFTNDQTTDQLWPPLNSYIYASMTSTNWTGSGQIINPRGFQINIGSFLITNLNAIALPTATYLFNTTYNGYHFQPITNEITVPTFEINLRRGLPQPHWWLFATNNLQVVMIDNSSGRIIDYVQLSGPTISRDLTAEILSGTNNAAMWLTNFVSSGILPGRSLPSGIENQLQASTINNTLLNQQSQYTPQQQVDGFRIFVGFAPLYETTNGYGATNLEIQACYTPTATPVQIISLQANDPLVHYLASDLFDSANGTVFQNGQQMPLMFPVPNERYQPWGRSYQMASKISPDTSSWNLALKDPVAWGSDSWDFPTNQFSTVGWLGRVHRGTPWQTIYLKASDILQETNGTNTWMNWTGDFNPNDAAAMAPVQDWHLASLLTSLMNTNNLASLFSVNDPDIDAWQGLFDGLTAWTNSLPDFQTYVQTFSGITPQFDPLTISSNSIQAAAIASAIESVRVAQPGQIFHDVGDVLATPQLTVQSPFLNWNDSTQEQYGISDEAYEQIPSQLLPLLRADSIGSVVLVNSRPLVQFTGSDGHVYAIQTSSDLVNWVNLSTNCPVNGVVSLTNSIMPNANQQFYRSVLLQ